MVGWTLALSEGGMSALKILSRNFSATASQIAISDVNRDNDPEDMGTIVLVLL